MSTTEESALRLARPPWRILLAALRPAAFLAGLVAYAVALGGSGVWLGLVIAILVLVFAPRVVLTVVAAVGAAGGPDPGIDAQGVHARLRPWRRPVLLRWSEISAGWIGYVGREAFLCLRTTSAEVTGDRPVPVYIPRTVAPETVRAAVERLGGVAMWNHDPDPPGGRQRVRFTPQPASTARTVLLPVVSLVFWLLYIPFAMGVPQVWDQPWWS